MKTVITALLALGLATSGVTAGGDWLTDPQDAFKEAGERNVPVLADFSGSDWCGWCIKLEKEVFSRPEFKEYARKNYVLLLVDFPYHTNQPAEQRKKNRALGERYAVEGFPTVLLLDAEGNVLARTGYRKGGPSAYIRHLEALLNEK